MKVSVLSRGSPDYLIDIVTDGLIRLLGRQYVHLRYNQTSTDDTLRSQLFSGFGDPNTIDFLDANFLVASVRSSPSEIAAWVKETGGGPVAVVDGEDDPEIRGEHYKIGKLYFKREYLIRGRYPDRVRPLPFAAIPEPVPNVTCRDIDVSFSVTCTAPIRADLSKMLQALPISKEVSQRAKGEYNVALARSKVGISARGAGWDTYRYWETAYFGCALLSQRLAISIPGNFTDGAEAVFFDHPQECQIKLQWLLADQGRCAEIAERGRAACMARHLSTHRAQAVLDSMS